MYSYRLLILQSIAFLAEVVIDFKELLVVLHHTVVHPL